MPIDANATSDGLTSCAHYLSRWPVSSRSIPEQPRPRNENHISFQGRQNACAHLHSLPDLFPAFLLIYVGQKLERRRSRKLRTRRGWRIIEIDNIVQFAAGRRLGGRVWFHEGLNNREGRVGVLERTAEVVPCRGVVRSERDPFLRETTVATKGRNEGDQPGERTKTKDGDARELPPEDLLPILIARPNTTREHDKEPMVPRGVIPHVFLQQLLGVRALPRPKARLIIEVDEDPLAVGPCVVVLGVGAENGLKKLELARRRIDGVERGEQQTAMVPDLVRFEEGDRDVVHVL